MRRGNTTGVPRLQRLFIVPAVALGIGVQAATPAGERLVAAAAATATQGGGTAASIPAGLFAGEPRGRYPTGTLQTFWVDPDNDEPSTADPDDKRRITVQVWYPAALRGDEARAPYLLTPEQYLIETTTADHDMPASGWRRQLDWAYAVRHVRTNSVRDATVAGTGERFPVLIYSHGGGNPHFSGTFLTEFMASHGYVVVAISHPSVSLPGSNGIFRQRYPDGYVYDYRKPASVPASPLPDGGGEPARDLWEARWNGSRDGFGTEIAAAVKNVSFVLDRLAEADRDRDHRLYGRLDLERVGAVGWSMGGVVSLQASLAEPRVKAAINGDGWPFGLTGKEGVVTKGSPRPVMVMSAGRWPVAPEQREASMLDSLAPTKAAAHETATAADLHMWSMFRRSAGPWYWLRIEHASHAHFSDHALFSPDPGRANPQQLIHPRLAHAIINHYSLEFFDRHLRGREETPLLSGQRRYRDAVLLSEDHGSDAAR